jgi:hypothetical protein
MRGLGRRLVFGVLLTLLVGVGAVAQLPQSVPYPPEPLPRKESQPRPVPAPGEREQLKAYMAALLGERNDAGIDDGASNERARLKAQLRELLKRIDAPRSSPGSGPNPHIAPKPIPVSPSSEDRSVDPNRAVREGMNRFRDNDFDVALGVFRHEGLLSKTAEQTKRSCDHLPRSRRCTRRRVHRRVRDLAVVAHPRSART